MASEIAAKSVSYNPVKADVWSLGVILFIILTESPLALKAERRYRALHLGGVHSILVSWGLRDMVRSEVVALLPEMLQVDPSKWITVDAALAVVSSLWRRETRFTREQRLRSSSAPCMWLSIILPYRSLVRESVPDLAAHERLRGALAAGAKLQTYLSTDDTNFSSFSRSVWSPV